MWHNGASIEAQLTIERFEDQPMPMRSRQDRTAGAIRHHGRAGRSPQPPMHLTQQGEPGGDKQIHAGGPAGR